MTFFFRKRDTLFLNDRRDNIIETQYFIFLKHL